MNSMVTYRDFMETALYDARRGFYAQRALKEDFYTAPELHPAFAEILTRKIAGLFTRLKAAAVPGPYSIVEMGSGSGLLARQVLDALRRGHPEWSQQIRYVMVERTRNLLLESMTAVPGAAGRLLGFSRLEDVPQTTGVFFSNELVDAFPFHLLEKKDGEIVELYVESSGGLRGGELSRPELAAHAAGVEKLLPEGGRHAVNLEAPRWTGLVAEKLKAGFLLTVDYGGRSPAGTILPNPPRAYSRHRVSDAGADRAGETDITASVDFETLIQEGVRHGLALESFQTMGAFLLENGIGDLIEGAPARSRSQIKTLIHPEGMGESFKVLLQRREPLP